MAKPLQRQVGDRIAQILREKGLRQQDLVKSTGLSKSYISLILHGNVNLTLETIETLEKALKTHIIRL